MFCLQIGKQETVPFFNVFQYDEFTRKIELIVKFSGEGCYHAAITLNGIELHHGEFDIVVLNSMYCHR